MAYWGCMLILAYYTKIAKTLSYKRSDADFFLVLAASLFCLNAAEEGLGGREYRLTWLLAGLRGCIRGRSPSLTPRRAGGVMF